MGVSTTNVRKCSQKQLPEVFYKKGVLNNFEKFPEKRLCQSLLFHKVAGLRPLTSSVSFLSHNKLLKLW